MANYVGMFRHKLDKAGRVSVPSNFRKLLTGNLKVTQAPTEKCLYVFEAEAFDAWVDSIFESKGGYSSANLEHVKARRLLNARATDVDIDSAGRINISADLRSVAELDKEVVIAGNGDHIEIWDAKRWDDFDSDSVFDSLFASAS